MARGSKDKYTEKQKRKAEHIEEGYKEKGVKPDKAEAIAWATVNKQSGGGERSGSGKSKPSNEKQQARKTSAKRAAASRKGVSRGDSLKLETKEALLQKARARNIPGRSTMNKEQLIEALR
ncbi:MAG: termination factor Rho [Cellvibrio sp.]|jgi:plasmid stabilization system protein ParE